MTKQELIELIENLPGEDREGKIEGIFCDKYGAVITTDSIRVDMDGGRIILAQKGSGYHSTNHDNWQQELTFCRNHKKANA
jgi:hypothetical protein